MQRVRLGVFATVALVGTLALSGCQHSPTQAVQIGDVSLDNTQVDATASAYAADLAAAGGTDRTGDVRQVVVQLTVFNELARRYAKEKGIQVTAPDYQAYAANAKVSADDPFVRLNAEKDAYLAALLGKAKPQTPTDADMQDVYQRYAALVGADAAGYSEIKQALLELPEYSQALGLRTDLLAALNRYGLAVNPRYTPLSVDLVSVSQGRLPLVTMQMGDQGTGAVRDLT